jgi:riboflavin synthase
MFTGIIQEIGKTESIKKGSSSVKLEVSCEKIAEDVKLGDSISVNGTCLSVVDSKAKSLSFDVVINTFSVTNLKRLRAGSLVNLESALKLGEKVSGHMVTGHIDGERIVKSNSQTSRGWTIEVGTLPGDEEYLVSKGAVAIDGISLTIGELLPNSFKIFLIPHTLENTTLKLKKCGDYVNVEFDIMAKYAKKNKGSNITEKILREKGFI